MDLIMTKVDHRRTTEASKKRAVIRRRKAHLVRMNTLTRQGQDIGKLPSVKNPARRKRCLASFALFCVTYFPEIFYLKWSKDLLKVIAKIERVVIDHDMLAVAMPRGSGKSSLVRCAILWAMLSGRHRFAMLIGAVAPDGSKAIEWFKDALSKNDRLLEDFPAVCYPIRLLDNEPRRCLGQRYRGKKTAIRWGKDEIVLPTIPHSGIGGCIRATSLGGQIRGKWQSEDGKILRPTLAMCDDPQTSESSKSQGTEGQTTTRLLAIQRDVQGLAGPDQQTAILVPCTVICPGDLSDQLLNRKKYPDFRGERTKRLYSWPTNKGLWEQYRELRESALQADQPLMEATDFYKAHRATCGLPLDAPRPSCQTCPRRAECMDCGAVVDWAERLDDPRNLSAVQAAMHAFYKYGAAGFAAEFQNEPLQPETFGRLPSADQIMQKANGYQRGTVPEKAIRLTAFIDPGDDYLTWLVCAWEANFTGAVIDFGTWPDQGQDFSKATVRHPLNEKYPGTAKEGAILAGLKDLLKLLLARQFFQGDNPMQIGLCMVDTGYKPDVVHAALRITRQAAARPSRGRGITAGKVQFDDYKRDRCREMGLHWWIPKDTPHAVIQIDTNFWKTFVHSRLATAAGDPGALTLFGQPEDHALLAAHILAEYYTLPKTEKDVTVQEWHQHVGRDNELFDALVGAAAGAAKLGCSVITAKGPVRIIQTPAVPWRRQQPEPQGVSA
jgi:hypothetical protein